MSDENSLECGNVHDLLESRAAMRRRLLAGAIGNQKNWYDFETRIICGCNLPAMDAGNHTKVL